MAIGMAYDSSTAAIPADLLAVDMQLIQMMLGLEVNPTLMMFPMGAAVSDRKFGWTVEAPEAVTTIAGKQESAAYATAGTTEIDTLQNGIRIDHEVYGLSLLRQAIDTYAKEGQWGFQRKKAVERLSRRNDLAALWGAYNAGASGQPYQTSGLMETIGHTGAIRNSGGASGSWAGGTIAKAFCSTAVNVAATLTLANFNTNTKAFYELGNHFSGQNGYVIMHGSGMAAVINNILVSQVQGLYSRSLDAGTIGGQVRFVTSDWATFTPVVHNHHMDSNASIRTLSITGPSSTYNLSLNGTQDIVVFKPSLVRQRWLPGHTMTEKILGHSATNDSKAIHSGFGIEYANPASMLALLDVN